MVIAEFSIIGVFLFIPTSADSTLEHEHTY